MTTYRGAYATIQYIDGGQVMNGCYFSIGGEVYDEDGDTQQDTFGISDHDIYYFCDKGEPELKELMNSTFDFKVLDYKLVEA
jgi:hypothetical protein